jgi:hypothetical protein
LAEAIQYLLHNKGITVQFGEAGREHVEKYWGWEHAICALEKHIEETILDHEA